MRHNYRLLAIFLLLSACSTSHPQSTQNDRPLHALTFTGWGQAGDALDPLLPPGTRITHYPYYAAKDREDMLTNLKALPEQPDIVVGWSLGGRLAARAVAQGILRPRLFVMIGSTFEYAPGKGLDNATRNKPNAFYQTYKASPTKARALLAETMLAGDKKADVLRKRLKQDTGHDADWLRWLTAARFGSEDVDFSRMPRTVIVHCRNDAVVHMDQAQLFKKEMPGARLELLPDCGHLPHLHDPATIRTMIEEELAARP